jgi:hypothetical protein
LYRKFAHAGVCDGCPVVKGQDEVLSGGLVSSG